MTKKKIFILVLIFLAVTVTSIYYYKNYDSTPKINSRDIIFNNLEAVVEKKSFDSEMEKTGTTKIRNEQKIKFNTSGRITEVNVKVWDEVKKWDILVRIDSSKAQSDIDKAVIELDKAKRNLNTVIKDLWDSKLKNAILELETAKNSIEQKERDLSYLKEKQQNELKSKKNEIETAKNTYIIDEAKIKKDLAISKFDNKNNWNSLAEKSISYEKQKRDYEEFKANFDSKLNKKINEFKLKLDSTYYDLEKDVRDFKLSLDDMAEVLGLRNGQFAYSTYFSVKNSLNIWKIKEYYFKASQEFKKMETAFKKVRNKEDSKNIVATLEAWKDFYSNAYLAYSYLNQWFEDSVSADWFNVSEWSGKFSWSSSRAASMRWTIIPLIDELKNYDSEEKIKKDLKDELEKSRIALENTEIEIKKFTDEKDFTSNTTDASQKNLVISLAELKNSLNQKLLDYSKFEQSQKDEYRQAEIALEKEKIALKNLEESFQKLKNISKNDEYLSAYEWVKQAELSVETARKWLEAFVIQAPFDWVITKIDYKVWDRLTENDNKSVSITDPKTIEILVNFSQNEIIKIKKDTPVKITLDAYPDSVLDWKLEEIDTTPTTDERTWLSKFSAKAVISDYGKLKLYTGMQATIKIKTETIPEGLVVPFSAVNSDDDGKKFVTVVSNGKKEKRYVEVWYSDGKYYQITSGLKEWEKVLEIDYDATKIKDDQNNFWWSEWWGWSEWWDAVIVN